MVRANVGSLVKLIAAFEAAGVEMIDKGAVSNAQGRGVRLKTDSGQTGTLPGLPSHDNASSGTRGRT
jgi:hypothetical protein